MTGAATSSPSRSNPLPKLLPKPASDSGGGLFLSRALRRRGKSNPPPETRKPARARRDSLRQVPGRMGIFPRHSGPPPLPPVFRSAVTIGEILPLLPDTARIVLRAAGIALSKVTSLTAGHHGLQLDPGAGLGVHFLRCPVDASLTCALRGASHHTPLSLHFPGTAWESPATRQLLNRCKAIPTAAPGIWSTGAGAWLDEGLRDDLRIQSEMLYLLSLLDESRTVNVHAVAAGCSLEASFRPTFIDLDGSLLRIADRHGQHAIYLHPERIRARQDRHQLHLHSLPA